MPDVQQVIAGRKAIEAYRLSHAGLHQTVKDGNPLPIDHSEIKDKMFSALKGLGFNSVEEFMKASMQAILDDMERCIRHEGECDNCEGREEVMGCNPKCHEENTTLKGRTSVIPDIQGEGEVTINYFMDYAKALPPRKKGRVTQMLPNCSIIDRLVEDPALDWDWRG